MPVPGYSSITIREEVYQKLDAFAKLTCRTIPEVIEYLLKTNSELANKEAGSR